MKTQNKITLGSLCESSNIPASLIRAVVRQMGGWKSLTESAPDITSHGIDGGFSGFNYNDTVAFARRNRAAIAKMAESQADDFGSDVFTMIQGFGCFRNSDKPTNAEIGRCLYGHDKEGDTNTMNALAWYAGEEVSRAYCDLANAE